MTPSGRVGIGYRSVWDFAIRLFIAVRHQKASTLSIGGMLSFFAYFGTRAWMVSGSEGLRSNSTPVLRLGCFQLLTLPLTPEEPVWNRRIRTAVLKDFVLKVANIIW